MELQLAGTREKIAYFPRQGLLTLIWSPGQVVFVSFTLNKDVDRQLLMFLFHTKTFSPK